MKFVSWNVNGIRAVARKGFSDIVKNIDADVVCLQETKASPEQTREAITGLDDYHIFANSAERKGYSGTAILTRKEPISVSMGLGIAGHDQEGRVITAEFSDFYLVTVYTPNSGNELARLDYRKQWDTDFLQFLQDLEKKKFVIVCGDLNVAHQPIDIARPKENYNKSAGYTQVEIDGMDALQKAGFIDTWRLLNPEKVKYSWWSFRAGARSKNIGWRIDYFLASAALKGRIKSAEILNEVMGSDHCPVSLEIK